MNNDNKLIARFLSNNDNAAFAELVKRHQSAIRQFLRRLTAGDYHYADDIAQETFLLMYKKLHSFNGQSTLSTWLHTIAYRCFLKHLKSNKATEPLEDHHIEQMEFTPLSLTCDIALEQLMRHLSINERLMLTLSYSAGMSHSEIVHVTEVPLGTVKSYISRAKKKLQKKITPEGTTL